MLYTPECRTFDLDELHGLNWIAVFINSMTSVQTADIAEFNLLMLDEYTWNSIEVFQVYENPQDEMVFYELVATNNELTFQPF